MEFLIALVVLACLFVGFEYRIRRPDDIVVYEGKKGLAVRTGRFYPRHFSLPIRRTTHSVQVTVDASAKGNLEIRAKLAVTVGSAAEHLSSLVRVGGWSTDAVTKAAKELEPLVQGFVKEYTEQYGIEDLSSEKIHAYLNQKVPASSAKFGLEVISLVLLSFEPLNPQISEALRQQETARILEQTESLNQKARIASAKAKLKADEEIAALENELELKNYDLKVSQLERESVLANLRVEEELKRNLKKLEFEKEELEMLRKSPELLMLTPQAARLAEASQGLKNARTVVSLSPQDAAQGSELLGMFQKLLASALESYRGKEKKTK
ncbi:MAG TPA: hypothetical protein VMM37_04385 [Bacteroidota bacterium]|nr:hypothetical protein [Bacteroidota bacterium]